MKLVQLRSLGVVGFVLALLLCDPALRAESCLTSTDMDAATRNALAATALRYFEFIAAGDVDSVHKNAIASLAADFSGAETAVKENQSHLAGAKATARPPFLLEADGAKPIPQAQFYCGIFGRNGQTSDSAAFSLNDLAPGKYGIVILDTASAKGAFMVSFILQSSGSEWKLGNLYIQTAQWNGHDSAWFVERAEQFRKKGETHNAWLYYLVARGMVSPLPFMSTAYSDKLYDDSQKLQPSDFPGEGKTADLVASSEKVVYKLTALFPQLVGDDLDLVVKYQALDASKTHQTYQENVSLIRALVARYPELRGAFAAIVARTVDPNGRDYGTMLAMKDIK